MWYKIENGNSNKPEQLDTESSNVYNYVRKNFTLVEATEDKPEHWEWDETKILKSDWETYEKIMSHDGQIEDMENALIEIAEMIVG